MSPFTLPGGGGSGGSDAGTAPQVAPPSASSWTIRNGIGTAPNNTQINDRSDGCIHLRVIGSTGAVAQLVSKPLKPAPYLYKARIRTNFRSGSNNFLSGVGLYTNGGPDNGKLTSIVHQNTSSPTILSGLYYSSPTLAVTQNAIEGLQSGFHDLFYWMQDDNAGHRIFGYSLDGVDWRLLTNQSSTLNHVPNEVGWFGDPQSRNADFDVVLVSWEEG